MRQGRPDFLCQAPWYPLDIPPTTIFSRILIRIVVAKDASFTFYLLLKNGRAN